MSVHVSSWVWRHTKTVPAALRLVLVRLADIANDKGEAYPSLTTLAEDVNKKKRQIINDIAALQRLGLVVKLGRNDKTGRSTSNLYRIVMDGPETEPRVQQNAPSQGAAHCTLPVQPTAPSRCSPVHRPKSEPSVEPLSEPTEQQQQRARPKGGGEKRASAEEVKALRQAVETFSQITGEDFDASAVHLTSGAVRKGGARCLGTLNFPGMLSTHARRSVMDANYAIRLEIRLRGIEPAQLQEIEKRAEASLVVNARRYA